MFTHSEGVLPGGRGGGRERGGRKLLLPAPWKGKKGRERKLRREEK